MQRLRIFISPYFLSRYYRTKDIRYITEKYDFNGRIIDVGCGTKPHSSFFPDSIYKGIDLKHYSTNKDFVASPPDYYFGDNYLKDFKLPFKSSKFDHAVSFQVLEHHKAADIYLSEIVRIVKVGGYILITAPFMGGLHEEPYDYQRLTKYKLISMLENLDCSIVEFIEEGSIFSTIAMLLNEQNNTFAARNKACYLIAAIVHLPLLFFSYSCLIWDKIFRSKTIYFNYLMLAKKND